MIILPEMITRKARHALGLSAVGLCALSAPALAQNYDYYGGQTPPVFSGDAAGTEVRIQQFETQIRELTGRVEEQNYQIRQLQEQLEKITGDLALRLDDLERGRAGSSSASGGYIPPQPSSSTASGYDRGILDNDDAAPDNSGAYQWDSTRPGEAQTTRQLGTLTESGGADGPANQYENAFSALKSGDYNAAEKGFRNFIDENPKHVLAGNAKYWLGETYYVRGQFDEAARVFAEGYQQYPKSSKAPDNLLKLGMSLSSLNKKQDACVALGQIETQYASGAGPVLSRAKQEMTRLGC